MDLMRLFMSYSEFLWFFSYSSLQHGGLQTDDQHAGCILPISQSHSSNWPTGETRPRPKSTLLTGPQLWKLLTFLKTSVIQIISLFVYSCSRKNLSLLVLVLVIMINVIKVTLIFLKKNLHRTVQEKPEMLLASHHENFSGYFYYFFS